MGAYLDKPKTDKEVFEGEGHGIRYGGSSMQGWRKSMEDAHIAQLCLNNDPEISIFGVFDGHGGAEVAKFCQKYLVQEIQKLDEFSQGSMGDSLEKAFHRMDEMLRDVSFMEELEKFRKGEGMVGYESAGTVDAMEFLTRVLHLRNNRPVGTETPFLSKDLKPIDAGLHDDEEDDETDQSESILNGLCNDCPATADELEDMDAEADAVTSLNSEADSEDAGSSKSSNSSSAETASANSAFTPEKIQVHAGCTAVVALKRGNELFVANAGDSRGVLSRGGVAVALSEDHKPAHDTERSRILAAGGFLADIGGVCRVNGNLNLSRAIGDLKYKCNQELPPQDQIITAQPDVKILRLEPQDEFFILACDGVWDVLTNQDAVDFVSAKLEEGLTPSEVSSVLLDACLAKSPQDARGVGCDNMTAVVVQLVSRPSEPTADAAKKSEEAEEADRSEVSLNATEAADVAPKEESASKVEEPKVESESSSEEEGKEEEADNEAEAPDDKKLEEVNSESVAVSEAQKGEEIHEADEE